MRDSTSPADIPADGTQLVAGYGNGQYAWDAAGWDRWQHIPRASIDVTGDQWWRDVLDIEPGDAGIATAVRWVATKWQHRIIYPPVLYVNRSELTPLFNALAAANFRVADHFRLWVATLDGTDRLDDMTGVTAVQHKSAALTGGHYDESIVYDDAWMPGMPAPTPRPPVQQPRHLIGVELPTGDTLALTSTDGGSTWHK
jgi:hypothetical protein